LILSDWVPVNVIFINTLVTWGVLIRTNTFQRFKEPETHWRKDTLCRISITRNCI